MSGLVLDSSAILAYTQRKSAVAPLLGEVPSVVLPALALAETRAELAYKEELFLLSLLTSRLPHVLVAPLSAGDAVGVGRLAAMLDGRLGLAHAVAEAHRREALLLTAYGKAVRKAIGELDGIVDL
jgi:hypothetical protein